LNSVLHRRKLFLSYKRLINQLTRMIYNI